MKRREFVGAGLALAAAWPLRGWSAVLKDVGDVAAKSLDGADIALRGSSIEDFAASLRGDVLLAGNPDYDARRRVWNGIVRQASRAHRALHRRSRRPARRRFRARARAADRGARRRPQPVRQVHLRRRARDRPAADAGRARRPGGAARLSRGRLAARPARPRERRLRTCDHGRHRVRHRRRGPHARRRIRPPRPAHSGSPATTCCPSTSSPPTGTSCARARSENTDLFWGLRGGGGNFGVVTAIEYRLHPMDPTILGGYVVWPIDQARDAMRSLPRHRAWMRPTMVNLMLDVALGGRSALFGVEVCWSGDHAEGEQWLKPLRAFGKPAVDEIGPMPYVKIQSKDDAMRSPRRQVLLRQERLRDQARGTTASTSSSTSSSARRASTACSAITVGGAYRRVRQRMRRHSHGATWISCWQSTADGRTAEGAEKDRSRCARPGRNSSR